MTTPLVDIGSLSAPFTKLIETIGLGVGGLYAPTAIVKKAKAEAKAAIIRAEGQDQVADIEFRTRRRLDRIEMIRQENIEKIVHEAALSLPDSVSSDPVAQDWILEFLNSAQNVCDGEMQRIWARILAGEVVKPGSFGKRTLAFVKTLEKDEAEYFTLLSRFAFRDNNSAHWLIDDAVTRELLMTMANDHDLIGHFESIGVLIPAQTTLTRSSLLNFELNYFEQPLRFTGAPFENNDIIESLISFIRYSVIGNELIKIAGTSPIEGYVENLSNSTRDGYINLEIVRRN